MPAKPDEDKYKDSGQPLPYRDDTHVDRALGKPRGKIVDVHKLAEYPLAKLYGWELRGRQWEIGASRGVGRRRG